MIIDTHGHLVPPDLLATIRKDGPKLPSLKIIDNEQGLALGLGNAKPSRPAMKGLSDVAGRLAWMQKRGIDRQVSGGWPDWFGNDLRLKRNRGITPGTSDPMEALSLLYTDTIEHNPRVLRFVIEMMGADRVMLGSDMPFPIGDHEPMVIVNNAGLKPGQVAAISGGTAQKLFRINERMD